MRSIAEQLVEELHMHLTRIDEEVGAGQPIKSEDYGEDETERAVRQGAIAELDATNMYQQIADSVDDSSIKDLFLDIADEEKVHTGEFMKALDTLDPQDTKSIAKGEKEAAEKMGIEEALQQLHNTFPELNEAGGAVSSAFKAAGKQILTNVANKFGVQPQQSAAQPAQNQAQPQQQTQAPSNSGGGILSNVIGSAVQGYRNAKNQKASALTGLNTAGQSGVEVLNGLAQSVTSYANGGQAPQGTVPAEDSSVGPDAIDQPAEQSYGDANDGGGDTTPTPPQAPQTSANKIGAAQAGDYERQMSGYSMKHLMQDLRSLDAYYEGAPQQKPAKQSPQDAVMKAAKNFASKIQGKDASEWAKDPNLIKGLKAIVQGATQFKVSIPGLEGITPEAVDQAAQEVTQAAQNPQGNQNAAQGAAATPQAEQQAEQQVAQLNGDQLTQLINGMDKNTLRNLITSNPEMTKALASVLLKPNSPAQTTK